MTSVVMTSLEQDYFNAFPNSARLYAEACKVFPDGVTHDSRFLKPFPVSVTRGQGAWKWDVDGHRLIDYWMGHGSLILGHSPQAMVEAVQKQVALGTHLGASHELEIRWGEIVQKLIPSAEKVRFVSSGTEATLMALRVARIVTGRRKVLKFAGHFHGWHDWLIPGADGPHEVGNYEMPGISAGVMNDLVIVPPNDPSVLERAIVEHQPACVILEGTGGHWSLVPMRGEFLRTVRALTERHNVPLIFDEVITGFRVSPGGSQAHYGIKPDMTTLAKILAGGLPGGCLAGRAELMDALQFENRHQKKMKHPGTYNGNPLSAAAGVAVLQEVSRGTACEQANQMGQELRTRLNEVFERKQVNWVAYGEFSMVTVLPEYDGPRPDSDQFIPYGNAVEKLDRKFDPRLSHGFRCALLLEGVDFFGWRAMLSGAHTQADIAETAAAFDRAIDRLRGAGLLA